MAILTKVYLQDILKEKGLKLALIIIISLVIINVVLVLNYSRSIIESSETQKKIDLVKQGLNKVDKYMRQGEIGALGYILKQQKSKLYPINNATDNYSKNFDNLEINLESIGYDVAQMKPARAANEAYMQTLRTIIDLCDQDLIEEATGLFDEDRGMITWKRMVPFFDSSADYVDQLGNKSEKTYKKAVNSILLTQIFLILISIPILTITYQKISKDNSFKKRIFEKIDSSNKNYLFNDGKSMLHQDEDLITQDLISNLKKASIFINQIATGNYEISWEGLNKSNKSLNKDNIAGELMTMRDRMQKAKKEDDIRIWTNEGLSNFSDLLRNNQDNLEKLSDELISNIVQYLNAQQGGLFFVEEDENHVKYLKLMGCYAYQRKKFLEKRVEIGQGMVGQCFLEGETTYITNIPEEYVNITSGLGDTNPNALLIVPLMVNEDVVGVIEIASIKSIDKHEIMFLQRLSENIASSIASVKANENTKVLLEISQQQAEEMRAQEEEMRQNMEELQAAQEQMSRKNEEIENLLKQASENEESMKMNLKALEELQEEAAKKNQQLQEEKNKLEFQDAILSTLLEMTTERITVKDKKGYYLKLSKSKYQGLLDKGIKEIIGQSDREIFGEEHYHKSLLVEQNIMRSQQAVYNVEEQIKLSEDVTIWGATSRAALKDKKGQVLGTVVITKDITKEKKYEEELNKLKSKS